MDEIEPMLASAGELPEDLDAWALELKWDGVRALARIEDGAVRVSGRRGLPVTDAYPELGSLADLVAAREAVLDGEIVAFADGHPSFKRLQQRMHTARPSPALIRSVPIRYVVFDLLSLDGRSLFDVPYVTRRELLEELDLAAGPVEVPPYLPAEDREQVLELLAYTREENLEGLVAKRLDSGYEPGRRVPFWRKIKNVRTQEVVVVGWKPGRERRLGAVGSLLLGVYDGDRLHYAGHVETGFADADLDELGLLLKPLDRPRTPCAGPVPAAAALDAHWVEPHLVGEVSFAGWGTDALLLDPVWRGLRSDSAPREAIRE